MDISNPAQPTGVPSSPSFDPKSESQDFFGATQAQVIAIKPKSSNSYFPLYETLRLYAGWLLAWYGIIYAIGAYQHVKDLPFRIPYAESLFLSPLVLSFTFASFVFLLCTTLSKALPVFRFKNILLFLTGTAIFMLYRMNIA